MSFQLYLILFAALGIIGVASWVWFWMRAERNLKTSPPKQVCFEVQLARGADSSMDTMDALYRNVYESLRPHLKQFLNGKSCVSIVREVSRPHQVAELHLYVYCDPQLEDELKRRIRGGFRGNVFISNVDDPMAPYADAVRPENLVPSPAA